jgi:FtsP/CotA-like multicopper oxidase with cupredoxin domain
MGYLRTVICVSLLLCAVVAEPFSNPPVLESTLGILDLDLDAVEATIVVQGQTLTRQLYNATLDPPVFRVRQGDTFKLMLRNFLAPLNSTNIHWHGLAIAPTFGADNIFDEIVPNNTYAYNFQIPRTHQVGTYWYHSHAMEFSEAQVYQGMSGVFIIEPASGAISELFPQLAGKQERIFPLRELAYPSAPRVQLINLLANPTINMVPGDVEYWRFANVAANNRYTINFPAGITAVRVSSDGHYLNSPVSVTAITLMTGGRADVIVRANSAGTYQITTNEADMYGASTGDGSAISLVSVVAGGTAITPVQLPSTLNSLIDLREMKVTRKRSFQVRSPDIRRGCKFV